jgi:hypothetical protein
MTTIGQRHAEAAQHSSHHRTYKRLSTSIVHPIAGKFLIFLDHFRAAIRWIL